MSVEMDGESEALLSIGLLFLNSEFHQQKKIATAISGSVNRQEEKSDGYMPGVAFAFTLNMIVGAGFLFTLQFFHCEQVSWDCRTPFIKEECC